VLILFLQVGAARYNYAFPALRDRWRLINEVRKIVPVNFFLDRSK
jgi:hypothetical protein